MRLKKEKIRELKIAKKFNSLKKEHMKMNNKNKYQRIFDETLELMDEKPEYFGYLSAALEFEEEFNLPWEWDRVSIPPNAMAVLITRGIVRKISRRGRVLADRQAVKDALAEAIKKKEEKEKVKAKPIPKDLFAPIIGYEEIKQAFRFVLENPDPRFSILLVGPPASAKSLFMYEIEQLDGAILITGGTTTGPGIEDELIDRAMKGYAINYIIIDEFDGLKTPDYFTIRELQERGRLITTKSRKRHHIQIDAPVFAACNDTKRIPQANLSRFWKGGFTFEPYTHEEFLKVSRGLLKREGVKEDIALKIAQEVWRISKDIRDVVRLGRVAAIDPSKLDLWLNVMRKY
jgi:Holliday junction DNA helicase RuvB